MSKRKIVPEIKPVPEHLRADKIYETECENDIKAVNEYLDKIYSALENTREFPYTYTFYDPPKLRQRELIRQTFVTAGYEATINQVGYSSNYLLKLDIPVKKLKVDSKKLEKNLVRPNVQPPPYDDNK